MIKIAMVYAKIGFNVYYVAIDPWRKGYNYQSILMKQNSTFTFNKNSGLVIDDTKVRNHEYYRIYIQFK
jgi:hypothetical protein